MPNTNPRHPKQEEAEVILRELLIRYHLVRAHTAIGGDPVDGERWEEIFRSQETLVLNLIAEGLTTGRVLF